MPVSDTSSEVQRRQIEAYRSMSPDERTALAIEMSESMRTVATDGIRARHPEFDDRQVADELIRIWHGPDALARLERSRRESAIATR